jgi:hypothetical protein
MTEYERFGLVFTKTRVCKFGHSCFKMATKVELFGGSSLSFDFSSCAAAAAARSRLRRQINQTRMMTMMRTTKTAMTIMTARTAALSPSLGNENSFQYD